MSNTTNKNANNATSDIEEFCVEEDSFNADANKKVEENIKAKASKIKKPSTRIRVLWFFIKLIICSALLAVIAIAGYFGYQYYIEAEQRLQQQGEQVVQLTQQIRQLQVRQRNQQQSLQEDWLDYRQDLSDQQQIWQQSIQQRQAMLETRINKVLSNNDYQWLFTEVHYWLSLAQQRMNDDANSAAVIRLLKSAEQQLSVINWDEAALIKQAIIKDLTRLNNAKTFNLALYYKEVTQIQQLISKAMTHSTFTVINDANNRPQVIEGNNELEWYQPEALWLNTKDFFTQYVSVSSTANNSEQYLSRQQKVLLQQRVSLQFEQAKQALLNQQWSLYESIINNIKLAIQPLDMQEQQQWLEELMVTLKQRPTAEQLTLNSLVTFHQQMKRLNFNISVNQ